MTDFSPHADPPPTDDELALARVEPAWAHFAYGLRTGTRVGRLRAGTFESILASSLVQVHGVLEAYREAHGRGEPMAVLNAAAYCATENVPMPYWLADAMAAAVREFSSPTGRGTLDAILAPGLPTTGKRAATWRNALPHRARLYTDVSRRMARGNLSVDRALSAALREGDYPFGKTVARRLFDETAERQRRFLRARG